MTGQALLNPNCSAPAAVSAEVDKNQGSDKSRGISCGAGKAFVGEGLS